MATKPPTSTILQIIVALQTSQLRIFSPQSNSQHRRHKKDCYNWLSPYMSYISHSFNPISPLLICCFYQHNSFFPPIPHIFPTSSSYIPRIFPTYSPHIPHIFLIYSPHLPHIFLIHSPIFFPHLSHTKTVQDTSPVATGNFAMAAMVGGTRQLLSRTWQWQWRISTTAQCAMAKKKTKNGYSG